MNLLRPSHYCQFLCVNPCALLFILSGMLITLAHLPTIDATSVGLSQRCYSCMSKLYSNAWTSFEMEKLYYKPKTFSDQCRSPHDKGEVDHDVCQANCITITDQLTIGGKTANTHIRGCYTRIFKMGINRTLDSVLKFRNKCYNLTLAMLTGLQEKDNENDVHSRKFVYVCSCDSDLCNNAQPKNFIRSVYGFWWGYVLIIVSNILCFCSKV